MAPHSWPLIGSLTIVSQLLSGLNISAAPWLVADEMTTASKTVVSPSPC